MSRYFHAEADPGRANSSVRVMVLPTTTKEENGDGPTLGAVRALVHLSLEKAMD
jgi:hypothetical protein